MITFFAPASRCFFASSRLVKRPVDSITTSTPMSPHGRSAGSRSSKTLISLPSTVIEPPPSVTSPGNRPRIESYFRRWASVALSVMSLTATMSRSASDSCAARKRLRPMRPKPLMPTLTAMFLSIPPGWVLELSVGADRDLDPVAVRVEQVGGVVGGTVFGPLARRAVVLAAVLRSLPPRRPSRRRCPGRRGRCARLARPVHGGSRRRRWAARSPSRSGHRTRRGGASRAPPRRRRRTARFAPDRRPRRSRGGSLRRIIQCSSIARRPAEEAHREEQAAHSPERDDAEVAPLESGAGRRRIERSE